MSAMVCNCSIVGKISIHFTVGHGYVLCWPLFISLHFPAFLFIYNIHSCFCVYLFPFFYSSTISILAIFNTSIFAIPLPFPPADSSTISYQAQRDLPACPATTLAVWRAVGGTISPHLGTVGVQYRTIGYSRIQ